MGYQKREELKPDNTAVKVQIPSKVIEHWKPLYQVFKKSKNEGKHIKFMLEKPFINGRESIPQPWGCLEKQSLPILEWNVWIYTVILY